jgi:hypothetical protein
MPHPIAHFEICVRNLESSTEFYKKLFGWEISHIPEMNYGMIKTGGPVDGGLFQAQGEMKPYVSVYAEVDDIDAMLDKAEKLGAFIIARRTEIGQGFGSYGMFADADNNVIGLWSRK